MREMRGTFRSLTLWLALLLSLAAFVIYFYKISHNQEYTDFQVYYRTAVRARLGLWKEIYALELDRNSPFRYSPLTLALFLPLTLFSHEVGKVVWFVLQFLFYSLGFLTLKKSLDRCARHSPVEGGLDSLWIMAIAFLFVLRFCLDSFMIGQVTGFMFFCTCLSLDFWLSRDLSKAGLALLFPSSLKIGPAFLYGLLMISPLKKSLSLDRRAITAALFGCLGLLLLLLGICHETFPFLDLWRSWFRMLANDTQFFDSSHYGSQSLNSVLLRWTQSGWLEGKTASLSYFVAKILGCLGVFWVWCFRRPLTQRAEGHFFSMGLLCFLLFMPFTFKYSLPFLAVPTAFLLAGCLKKHEWLVLAFGALTLSLGGLDIVGEPLFFWLQRNNFPFLAMLLISVCVVRNAWLESVPRSVSRTETS